MKAAMSFLLLKLFSYIIKIQKFLKIYLIEHYKISTIMQLCNVSNDRYLKSLIFSNADLPKARFLEKNVSTTKLNMEIVNPLSSNEYPDTRVFQPFFE